MLAIFILTLFSAQLVTADPLAWGFVEYNQPSQALAYSVLQVAENLGLEPIYFPSSNTSADYKSETWRDPCYLRYKEVGGTFIAFWLVNGDMYCEVYKKAAVAGSYTPAFERQYLHRLELAGKRCSTQQG